MTTPREASFVVRQEPDRLDRRRLARIAVLMIVAFSAALVASTYLLRAAEAGRDLGPTAAGQTTLILGGERGIALRNEQRASLHEYGWVDRDAGRARIPIDTAMDLLLEGGAP
jgi:hypothetical protein